MFETRTGSFGRVELTWPTRTMASASGYGRGRISMPWTMPNEHRGVGSDSQREDKHDRGGETGASLETAQRVAHVHPQIVEPAPTPYVAGAFSNQGRVPQRAPRRAAGVSLCHTGVPPPLALQLQMEASALPGGPPPPDGGPGAGRDDKATPATACPSAPARLPTRNGGHPSDRSASPVAPVASRQEDPRQGPPP